MENTDSDIEVINHTTTATNTNNTLDNSIVAVISETLLITFIPIIIGLILNYNDPFLLEEGFPWCILASLLVGLRYGFIYGFSSALLYVFILFSSHYLGLIEIESFPFSLSVGLLLTGMLAGEFRDLWEKNNYQLTVENQYKENRLRELSKVYMLLQVSHNYLEQRVLGSPVSLRSILMRLKDSIPLSEIHNGSSLSGITDNLLSLFGEYGGVQIASLYKIYKQDDYITIGNEPIGVMGRPKPVNNMNILVQESIKTASTIVASNEVSIGEDNVIAVVPFVNTNNEIQALLTINEMVFVDYNYKTFDLLTLIGGYIGDAMSNISHADDTVSFTRKTFHYHIKRSLNDIKRCEMPISLVVFKIKYLENYNKIYKIVRNNSRKLDQLWVPGKLDSILTIGLLMPLTDETGASKYILRIEEVFYTENNKSFFDSGINVKSKKLSKKQSSRDVFKYITYREEL